MRPLLLPLSGVYWLALTVRNLAFEAGIRSTRKLPVPVLSIGNLTLGGSGKTPCTLHLAEEARRRGLKAVVLTRGYKGRARGTCLVSDRDKVLLGPGDAGDEAYLLARKLPGTPIVKCPDRYGGGIFAFDRFKPDLFILDDGYQHRQLFRNFNILLVSDPAAFLQERMFPAGRLREPRSAVSRADEILVTSQTREGEPAIPPEFREWAAHRPISVMGYVPKNLIDVSGNSVPVDILGKERVFAFCGIAEPERFRNTLKALSFDVIEFRAFRDHHDYSVSDERRLREQAHSAGADRIVTTEKDMVKLSSPDVWALQMTTALPEDTLQRIFTGILPERGQRSVSQHMT